MANKNSALISKGLIGLIQTYRNGISPAFPARCRYLPTCSQYACDAITEHGALKGIVLATKRIARCHPFGGHGFDPVPQQNREKL